MQKLQTNFGDVKGLAVFCGVFQRPPTQFDLLHPLDVLGMFWSVPTFKAPDEAHIPGTYTAVLHSRSVGKLANLVRATTTRHNLAPDPKRGVLGSWLGMAVNSITSHWNSSQVRNKVGVGPGQVKLGCMFTFHYLEPWSSWHWLGHRVEL
jgi:hypothetical protein